MEHRGCLQRLSDLQLDKDLEPMRHIAKIPWAQFPSPCAIS